MVSVSAVVSFLMLVMAERSRLFAVSSFVFACSRLLTRSRRLSVASLYESKLLLNVCSCALIASISFCICAVLGLRVACCRDTKVSSLSSVVGFLRNRKREVLFLSFYVL